MNKFHYRAMGHVQRSEEENDDLVIFGVASAGNLDRKGTFIDQDSLWDAAKRAATRPLFWEHDWGAPIGTVEAFMRGDNELLARSRIGKDFDVLVSKGLSAVRWSVNNIRALVQQLIVRGYSIGFEGTPIEDKNGGPPTILVDDLLEVSLCSIPANVNTNFGFARAWLLDTPKPTTTTTITNPPANNVTTQLITTTGNPQIPFQLAAVNDDDNLEDVLVALESLKEAVADWRSAI